MNDLFRKFSNKTSELVGSPWAFLIAFMVIVVWAISGPVFGFSDTWQLVINTGTTIITFLMVFLIQNTQNRDNKAIHLKLDELILSKKNARNSMLDLEDLSDEEIKKVQAQFMDIIAKRDSQITGGDQVPANDANETEWNEGAIDTVNEREAAFEETSPGQREMLTTRK